MNVELNAGKLATALGLLLFVNASVALDVSSYEKLRDDSTSVGVQTSSAKWILMGYFSGVADELNFNRQFGVPVRSSLGSYCIPNSVRLTGEMLRTMADQELESPQRLPELMGANWKSSSVAASIVMQGLIHNYPCR